MSAAARLIITDIAGLDAGAPGTAQSCAPAASGNITFSLIGDRKAFDALEDEWNDLFARAGKSHQLFLGFNWLWHWCNHYLGADGARLAILAGRRNGRLVMVWPLVSERVRGLTVLSWMGDPVSQYGDVLIEDCADRRELLSAGWEKLRHATKADVVRLRKVREDAAVAPLFRELGGRITETLEAPFLDLSSASGYAAYEERYSRSIRGERRRLMRRLCEKGEVSFDEQVSGAPARQYVQDAVAMKRRWLADRGLVSKAFADDRFTQFFCDVAGAETRPAGCTIIAIKTAGRPIAFAVTLGCQDRLALHILTFDIEFSKAGAGVLLLEESIRRAANTGLGCYDMLAPGDSYKLGWADGAVKVQDWALPLTLAGRLYSRVYLDLARNGGKKLLAKIPAGARRRISGALSHFMAHKAA